MLLHRFAALQQTGEDTPLPHEGGLALRNKKPPTSSSENNSCPSSIVDSIFKLQGNSSRSGKEEEEEVRAVPVPVQDADLLRSFFSSWRATAALTPRVSEVSPASISDLDAVATDSPQLEVPRRASVKRKGRGPRNPLRHFKIDLRQSYEGRRRLAAVVEDEDEEEMMEFERILAAATVTAATTPAQLHRVHRATPHTSTYATLPLPRPAWARSVGDDTSFVKKKCFIQQGRTWPGLSGSRRCTL